jgi:hypothetical protein
VRCDVDSDQQLVTADVKKHLEIHSPENVCCRNIGLVLLHPRVLQFEPVSHSDVNPKAFIIIVIRSGFLCCLNYFCLILF